ncbi:uncharacterized protein LOC125178432 [Hyalella azteca]|uniref:Uncharacterized protein LOC125178432 n=1 Tax=Hyalella azteca TaxID=294128 RepID=A0A979FNP1_HYAAZ|nr:uncharacterized protein LOC125178432 [Hyalella azteca]
MPSGRGLRAVLLVAAVVLASSQCRSVVAIKKGNSSSVLLQHQLYNHHQLQPPLSFIQEHQNKLLVPPPPSAPSAASTATEDAGDFLPIRPPSLGHQNPRLKQITRRYQEKQQQKRHTLLALVRAAIPYPPPSASNVHPHLFRRPGGPPSTAFAQEPHFLQRQRRKLAGPAFLQQEQNDGLQETSEDVGEDGLSPSLWLHKRGGGLSSSPATEEAMARTAGGENIKSMGTVPEGIKSDPGGGEGSDGASKALMEGEGDSMEAEYGEEGEEQTDAGQEEVNLGLQQVGSSINHAFFRSARSSARPYDVPQIGPEPTTLSPYPSTLSPEPSSLSPEPSTLSHEPTTLSPEPSTLSHEPTTLSPAP